MALTHTPEVDWDTLAPPFSLTGTEGQVWTREQVAQPQGLLVMFICNHCPYVQAIIARLVDDCRLLQEKGIGCIAIMPNDTHAYPEDSLENMVQFAQDHRFSFPYVIDDTQRVAQAYGAVCTPDFFGYNSKLQLKYRGHFDQAGMQPPHENNVHALREAMLAISQTGTCTTKQRPSIGCSIKWR